MENIELLVNELKGPTQYGVNMLNEIQSSPIGWQVAEHLLSLENLNCKFYGALTMQMKINRNSQELRTNLERMEGLGRLLINYSIEALGYSKYPELFIMKLLMGIIGLDFQNYLSGELKLTNQFLNLVNGLPNELKLFGEMARFQIYQLIPEQFDIPIMPPDQRNKLKIVISSTIRNSALDLIRFYLNLNISEMTPDMDRLRHKSLTCLSEWINFGLDPLEIPPLVQLIMGQVNLGLSIDLSVQLITDLLDHRNAVKVKDTLYILVLQFLISNNLNQTLQRAIQEENIELGSSLSKLFRTFEDNFTQIMLKHMKTIPIDQPNLPGQVLEMALNLTNFPGQCPLEQDITEDMMEFWYVISEESMEDFELNDSNIDPKFHHPKSTVGIILTKLVGIVQIKCMYPNEDELSIWGKDEMSKFRSFRLEAVELMSNCFHPLKRPFIEHFIHLAANLINNLDNLNNGKDRWQELESTLFLLKRLFGHPQHESTLPLILQLLSIDYLGKILNLNNQPNSPFQNWILKNRAITLMEGGVKHVMMSPSQLNYHINLIINLLPVKELADSATIAFRTICDSASTYLASGVDEMINTINHLYDQFQPEILKRLVGSIAGLIGARENDRQLIPIRIEKLTFKLVEKIEILVEKYSKTSDPNLIPIIENEFELLSHGCNGLMTSTTELTVDSPIVPIPAVNPYSERIYLLITSTWTHLGHNDDISKVTCKLLIDSLRTFQVPSPFIFPLNYIMDLLKRILTAHPNPTYLNVCTQLLVSYGNKEPKIDYQPTMESIRSFVTDILNLIIGGFNGLQRMDDLPEMFVATMDFMIRFCATSPWSFLTLEPNALDAILQFSLNSLDTQDRTSFRVSCNLWVDILLLEKREKLIWSGLGLPNQARLQSIMINSGGMALFEKILKLVGGSMHRSYMPFISEMFRRAVNTHPQAKDWLNKLMAKDGFPSPHLNPNEKERFAIEFVKAGMNSMRFKSILGHFCSLSFNLSPIPFNETMFM